LQRYYRVIQEFDKVKGEPFWPLNRAAILPRVVNTEPEIMILLIELLPSIIHGHGPSHGTSNNRIDDTGHERVD
jgi:hypothetical protein